MRARLVATLLLAPALAGLASVACGAAVDHQASRGPEGGAGPTSMESTNMSQAPQASRPPAPVVPPVEVGGVRYQQDEASDKHGGDQDGGYLVAIDPKTGARLWMLKIYAVADYRAQGVNVGGIYFKSLSVLPGGAALAIENETGGRYRVDLKTRVVSTEFEPAPAPQPAAKPKPSF